MSAEISGDNMVQQVRFLNCLAIIWGLFVLCAAFHLDSYAAGGDIAERSGAKNPYGSTSRWTMFADDELAVLSFGESNDDERLKSSKLYINNGDDQISSTDGHSASISLDDEDIRNRGKYAAASGRFITANDEVVAAHVKDDAGWQLSFFDNNLLRIRHRDFDDPDEAFLDLVVGDFIAKVNDDGQFEDEIIVTHVYVEQDSPNSVLTIGIYNQHLETLIQYPDIEIEIDSDSPPIGIQVEKGDFNNDGILDFVVVIPFKEQSLRFYAFTFKDDFSEIVQLGVHTHTEETNVHVYRFDVTAGDFNGDAIDDIAVHYENLRIYSMLDPVSNTATDRFEFQSYIEPPFSLGPIRIASGLFYYDPENNFDTARRQIALVYFDPLNNNEIDYRISLYRVLKDFSIKEISKVQPHIYTNGCAGFNDFQLTAGNFDTSEEEGMPPGMSELALIVADCGATQAFFLKIAQDKWVSRYMFHVFSHETLSLATVPYDSDGDALKLGAPAHIVVENFVSLDTAMQEPPKHVDFLPKDPTQWIDDKDQWEVVNISAYPEFYVKYVNEDGTSGSVTESEHSTRSWIWSWAASVQATYELKLGGEKEGISANLGYKMSGSNTKTKESWDKHYTSTTNEISIESNDDDMLECAFQLIDIWRYPILNQKDEDDDNLFQDVFLPYTKKKYLGNGLGKEFYQPRHVNHNLLTYPRYTDSFPSDIGEYTVIQKDNDGDKISETQMKKTWNEIREVRYSANTVDEAVTFDDVESSGYSISHEHSLDHSVDVGVKIYAEATVGIETAKAEAAANAHAERNHHWGDSKIKSYEEEDSKSVKVYQPGYLFADIGWEYNYYPAIYVASKGGGWKSAFAVDFDQLDFRWWNYYGSRPDPALGLPYRLEASQNTKSSFVAWNLNEENSRMIMRGFFLYEKNSDSDEKILHSGVGIEEGDIIEAAARIYNLSLSQETGSFDVRFEAQMLDTRTGMEVDDEREIIGTATVQHLDPLEMQLVSVDWDTTGFGLAESSFNTWRIYVIVDPDNQVSNEIHEWKDEAHVGVDGWTDDEGRLYHGNNEGYFPRNNGYFVGKMLNQKSKAATLPDASNHPIVPHAALHEESLAIEYEQGIVTGGEIRVPLGGKYRLRTHITFDGSYHPKTGYIMFHDQNPESTNEVFSVELVRGLKTDNYIWTTWTPKEAGEYELWAVYLEHSNDPEQGDAQDFLRVTVYDPEDTDVANWPLH